VNVEIERGMIATLGLRERDAESLPLPASKAHLRFRLRVLLMVFDIFSVVTGFLLANSWRFGSPFHADRVNLSAMIVPVYFVAALGQQAYSIDAIMDRKAGTWRAVTALLFAIVAVLFIGFYLKANADFSRIAFSAAGFTSAILLVVMRALFEGLASHLHKGSMICEVIIHDGAALPRHPAAMVIDASRIGLVPDVFDPMMLDRLGRLLKNADRVIVACNQDRRDAWAMVLKGTSIRGEIVAPELHAVGALGTATCGADSTIVVSSGGLSTRNRALKRALDVVLASVVLIALIPVLIATAIAIRMDSTGPVLFRQQRLGRGNTLFAMYKFRSMRADQCDSSGTQSTRRDDDRITRVGRVIRATSIDELPQLLNVLRGEMSFVGPRPHALGSLAGDKLFWEVDQRYWHRHAAKPGVTGLAQIRGFRGATHVQSDLVNRLQADLEYLNGWSIWRDFSILLATFKVLVHRNAY
jgi:exopolysaccharide biosynthesis polyprenyl glycosylphosphotransferase